MSEVARKPSLIERRRRKCNPEMGYYPTTWIYIITDEVNSFFTEIRHALLEQTKLIGFSQRIRHALLEQTKLIGFSQRIRHALLGGSSSVGGTSSSINSSGKKCYRLALRAND